MKICSIIAEYNPFHNGHLRQIKYAREVIKPDYIVVIMSGNFTQRGETACMDKFTRARHAVLAGADAVIELPTVFATASAEFFASGAVKLINSLPGEKVICFGAENGNKEELFKVASSMLEESPEFKALLKEELKKGVSLLKARELALLKTSDINEKILEKPNNVLGVEYLKAILKNGYDIGVEVLERKGSEYNDKTIHSETPSALAIRQAVISDNLLPLNGVAPSFVIESLPKNLPSLDREILYSVLSSKKSELKEILDCNEGLENRISALARESVCVEELIEKVKTKRYTTARIRRILLSSLLKIDKTLIRSALKSKLYLKVLAINGKDNELLSMLSKSAFPTLTRKSDLAKLGKTAYSVFEKDVFACDVYSLASGIKQNEHNMIIVK
ncbi:MAG: nucleotidyltransferase family protein [Clostridia bacterium]|nr:nucleotidyltransferase family protein [Clostridia bacterium]